ncbi:MAG: hypothetical protein ACYDD2_13085 [Candidatus Acidiferrales bacterium]
MATKTKNEKEILEAVLNPNPKELDGEKMNKPKTAAPAPGCSLFCQLSHMWTGHPVEAKAPTEKATEKTVAVNSPKATDAVLVPKSVLAAACSALDALKGASEPKS